MNRTRIGPRITKKRWGHPTPPDFAKVGGCLLPDLSEHAVQAMRKMMREGYTESDVKRTKFTMKNGNERRPSQKEMRHVVKWWEAEKMRDVTKRGAQAMKSGSFARDAH